MKQREIHSSDQKVLQWDAIPWPKIALIKIEHRKTNKK